ASTLTAASSKDPPPRTCRAPITSRDVDFYTNHLNELAQIQQTLHGSVSTSSYASIWNRSNLGGRDALLITCTRRERIPSAARRCHVVFLIRMGGSGDGHART